MGDNKTKKSHDLIKEQPITYDDYARMPDEEGVRYEINDGKLEAMTPGPNAIHQVVTQEIVHRMIQRCSQDFLILFAPIDVILSEIEVRQPDIVMIRRDRLSIITKRGIEGPPDLVVEVLSPFSAKRDRKQKIAAYAKYNISEYWIVDASNGFLEQYLMVDGKYELSEIYKEDEVVRSPQIACISFTMNDIINSIPELPNF